MAFRRSKGVAGELGCRFWQNTGVCGLFEILSVAQELWFAKNFSEEGDGDWQPVFGDAGWDDEVGITGHVCESRSRVRSSCRGERRWRANRDRWSGRSRINNGV